MATEYPPLGKSYVLSYSNDDKSFPIVAIKKDPRVDNYRRPDDLSPHPEPSRYPNHRFTGTQPTNTDERVIWVYEILPAPWVPFTRYDDDLGPIQGRRRFVANSGQEATLERDRRVTFEAREGSAIVSTEIEESWDAGSTDPDEESPFPIKDRDFYDPSRGAVQERRQLVSTTGNEVATLENNNGVITQTSYEAYNEFLSFKVVQTYSVDGPQLIGKTTDNDGQLVTVTTQRKGADNYVPPSPTATRTVEVNREDAESLIERIVDTPEVFKANTFSIERPDPIPQKFRVAVPIQSSQEIVEGQADPNVNLSEGEISKSEEQRNKFIKRVSTTSRDQAILPKTLEGKTTNNDRQEVKVFETLQFGDTDESPTATTTVESEALGDGNFVITKTEVDEVFGAEVYRKTKEDLTPQKFKAAQEDLTKEENVEGTASSAITLDAGEFAKSEQQINKFVKRVSTTSRNTKTSPPLTEFVLTQQGQIGERTLTLSSGTQTISPSATLIDANVEALGDGRTVKTEVRVPVVFANKSITASKIDLTPEKFKAKQSDITTEESVAGTISPTLTLLDGEFRKSEEQVTEFIKRTSVTERNITATSDLKEFVVTPQGQLAERTLILSSVAQTIQPNALLIDGSIEALGDGRTIKTEVKVNKIFDGLAQTAQKPDTIPEKFRANAPTLRVERNVVKQVAATPTLNSNQFLKTEQRLTEFTVQETVVERAGNLNETQNQRLEENWGINIPYTEYISSSIPSGETFEGEGLDDKNHLVREYDVNALQSNLSSFEVKIPTSIDLDLPRVLKNIGVEWQKEKSSSTNELDTTGAIGSFLNLTQQDDGKVSSTLSLIPRIEVEFEDVWGKNLPATIHLFFLKKEDLTEDEIKAKAGAEDVWPVFKPKSFSTTVFGKTERKQLQAFISRAFQSNSTDIGYGYQPTKGNNEESSIVLTPVLINIPPCLTDQKIINEPEKLKEQSLPIKLAYESVTQILRDGGSVTFPAVNIDKNLSHEIDASVIFTVPATEQTDIPKEGIYLISSSAEPYKFGWFLVRAVTLDAKIFK